MPNPTTKFLLLFLFIACVPNSGQASPLQPASIERLREVIVVRLEQMPFVARYKWEHSIPVEDLAREAIILANTVDRAKALGIDENAARHLVVAQITAAKMIQNRMIADWQSSNNSQQAMPALKDLAAEIRPIISRLTRELLGLTAALADDLQTCAAHEALQQNGSASVTDAEWQTAVAGFRPAALSCQ